MSQSSNTNVVNNQSGQMIIEYILLTVITIGIAIFVSSSFRSNEFLAQMVSAPWRSLAGMIQNGSWGDPESTMANHPNHHANSSSFRGEPVR